ncbi:MAG: hypothetical protein N3B11_02495 [Coriobacteriia bacterium]|nr:hypothetical protein [Coriobacteriia bacterium]
MRRAVTALCIASIAAALFGCARTTDDARIPTAGKPVLVELYTDW